MNTRPAGIVWDLPLPEAASTFYAIKSLRRLSWVRPPLTPPGTVEHMHVAAGTVRVTVGDETAELSAGDSCSCRTDAPHGLENTDPSVEALIYLIIERG